MGTEGRIRARGPVSRMVACQKFALDGETSSAFTCLPAIAREPSQTTVAEQCGMIDPSGIWPRTRECKPQGWKVELRSCQMHDGMPPMNLLGIAECQRTGEANAVATPLAGMVPGGEAATKGRAQTGGARECHA